MAAPYCFRYVTQPNGYRLPRFACAHCEQPILALGEGVVLGLRSTENAADVEPLILHHRCVREVPHDRIVLQETLGHFFYQLSLTGSAPPEVAT